MRRVTAYVLTMGLAATAGNAAAIDWSAICCDGGYEYRHRNQFEADAASKDMAARLAASERERQRLADELAAARKDLAAANDRLRSAEAQIADRDRELASLRTGAGDSAKLSSQLSATESELSQTKARTADLERQLAASHSQTAALQAGAGDQGKLAAELAAAQTQLAALQAGSGDRDKLAAELAASQSQVAALQAGAGDTDKLAAELAATKQRVGELEGRLAASGSAGGDRDKLAADLADARRRIADLERQLAERDRELASLRGDLSSEMAKLKAAERGVIRALRPQIEKGTIVVDLNNERLLINLASGYLFGSGEDQLKTAGSDALKQMGSILKDFPEYKVAVDGHTDNRPIRSDLKKRFPTNKELSEARAANAAKALAAGGLITVEQHGYADTRPVMPNTTESGRAKNRRVEVRVTK